MHNLKELKIWQESMSLTKMVYSITQGFPNHEKFGLTSQINRCAVSVPSNIAEGVGRNSDNELIRFLNISIGSLFELDIQLILSNEFGYLDYDHFQQVESIMGTLKKRIISFRIKLERSRYQKVH
jgi:four helix bundle protein